MRVSTDESDPGYANFRGYGVHEVFLDGVKCERVLTADEERGEVVRAALNANGRIFVVGSGKAPTDDDAQREKTIARLHDELLAASDPAERRKIMLAMSALVGQRSVDQVRRIERDRGLR